MRRALATGAPGTVRCYPTTAVETNMMCDVTCAVLVQESEPFGTVEQNGR